MRALHALVAAEPRKRSWFAWLTPSPRIAFCDFDAFGGDGLAGFAPGGSPDDCRRGFAGGGKR